MQLVVWRKFYACNSFSSTHLVWLLLCMCMCVCLCMCMQGKTCICKKNQKIETGNWVSMSNARRGRGRVGKVLCFDSKTLLAKTGISQHLTLDHPTASDYAAVCVCVCICVYMSVLLSDCHSRVVFLMLDIWLRSLALCFALSLSLTCSFFRPVGSVDLALLRRVDVDCGCDAFTLSVPALVTSLALSPSLAHSRSVAQRVFLLDFVNF